jgi:hypothetical protein
MSKHIGVMLTGLLIVTGVLVLLPSGHVCAGGIVVNQSFEQGVGGVPNGWNLTGSAARIDTGPIYVGNWTALITGSDDTFTQWLYIGNGTVPLPVTYDVWGWIYVSGNVTGVLAFDFWQGLNGTQLSSTTELSTNDTNGAYVQVTSTLMAPVGATRLRIRLMGTGWNEGTEVRFDEIGVFPPRGGYCFIATAAYGTETVTELDTLRDFRDQVLLKNALGSLFVDTYYAVSPPIADFIAKNDFLRAVVREVFLDPIVDLLQWSQGLWRA